MDPPKGYRFHPTDWELITHYLKLMVQGIVSEVKEEIAEVDILKNEPCHLPALASIQSDDPYWYFFYKLRKYKNSDRVVRTTNDGYWKITGQDRNVHYPESGEVIGIKKTLTFYNGRHPKGVKTNWVKAEYHATAANFPDNQEDYVVCCLKKKPDDNADNSNLDEGESTRQVAPSYGNSSGGNIIEEMPMQQGYNYELQSYNDFINPGDQEFWDSLIVDPQDEDDNEHIHCDRSSPPKSIHMARADNCSSSKFKHFPFR